MSRWNLPETIFDSQNLVDPRNVNYSITNIAESFETRQQSPNCQLIVISEQNFNGILKSTNNLTLRYKSHYIITTIQWTLVIRHRSGPTKFVSYIRHVLYPKHLTCKHLSTTKTRVSNNRNLVLCVLYPDVY